ncbi:hypothetical protein LV457_10860 [Mycobacterium sp. MYCO198283]|uniref:hypothetical protein n=1 Tax=Mycobacterium sp. MYCO198283 TaxID=2883505 RepID=UPI001E51F6C3|nr:hypothetical protein [Mycobacterium sp. MYCO198283]MCG5432786.1 hypothetical protein [Mycobacterium sp. MYCO198283]
MVPSVIGGALCLLASLDALVGAAWYLPLGLAAAGVGILVGVRRRIFRPGVTRSGHEVICRYVPWYEGNAYGAVVVLTLFGVAMVRAGYAPGYPMWFRFGGLVVLGGGMLALYGVIRMWRRCFLRITSSALTVRVAKGDATDLRRKQVKSINPKVVRNAVNGAESLQVEITYDAADSSSDQLKTVLLGQQLSVEPVNLLNALMTWKNLGEGDSGELLERIERILRDGPTAGV